MMVTVTSENLQEFVANGGRIPEEVAPAPQAKEDVADEESEEKKSGNKFAKIRVERNEARRAAEEAKKEAADLRSRLEALEKAGKPQSEPKAQDFTDPVKYAEALADWKFERKEEERKQKEAQAKLEEQQAKITAAWNKQWNKISKEYEDFEEVTAEQIAFRLQKVTNTIYESDVGPRLAYYFSKNRDALDQINEMSETQALKYLGRIEAKIEGELEASKEAAKESETVKTVSVAGNLRRRVSEPPEPINPVRGIGSTTTSSVGANGEVINAKAFKAEMRKKLYGH